MATWYAINNVKDQTDTKTDTHVDTDTGDKDIKIYRSMRRSEDFQWRPKVDNSARGLGVRARRKDDVWVAHFDIETDDNGMVHPGPVWAF